MLSKLPGNRVTGETSVAEGADELKSLSQIRKKYKIHPYTSASLEPLLIQKSVLLGVL